MSLQGLLAHQRGEWFDRMRVELRRTRDTPDVANALFDGYLCAAEYLLYGPTPYAEVIDLAAAMRATAQRSGALRAAAFATALIGEAALLVGRPRPGRARAAATPPTCTTTSARRRRGPLAAAPGRGPPRPRRDEATARDLLDRALPLARWSMIARHLLQRIYGTMILAAADPLAARAIVDRAESTLGVDDCCVFCSIMLSVPAAIACARSGDLDHARHHLAIAERSAKLWEAVAWQGWYAEAVGHVAVAEGDHGTARQRFADAAARFERAGQPLDSERCRRLAVDR